MYIYIYMCVCVCVCCGSLMNNEISNLLTIKRYVHKYTSTWFSGV